MHRLEHTMFLAINKGALLLSILAPEQKHQFTCLAVQPVYHSISELLPALEEHGPNNMWLACDRGPGRRCTSHFSAAEVDKSPERTVLIHSIIKCALYKTYMVHIYIYSLSNEMGHPLRDTHARNQVPTTWWYDHVTSMWPWPWEECVHDMVVWPNSMWLACDRGPWMNMAVTWWCDQTPWD